MTLTLKINARNDLHLPSEVLKFLNLGEEKIIKATLRGNALILVPVDLEERYSHEELEGLDRLHAHEKKKGFVSLASHKDIEKLLN